VVDENQTVSVLLMGGAGNDTLIAGGGSSVLDGGEGNDVLTAGVAECNVLMGGAGDDRLTGGGESNVLDGGAGDDVVISTGGTNEIIGGGGSNTFVDGGGESSFVVTPGSDIPEVFADRYSTDEDRELVIPPELGLLENDVAPQGASPLWAVVLDAPLHGVVVLCVDGSFSYTPDRDYHGVDTFTYRTRDSQGSEPAKWSDPALVSITVSSVIDAPIDIKPGSYPNSINLDANGVLPVAILSTQRSKGELEDFDAALVDVTKILFGDSRQDYGRVRPIRSALEDVDWDGDLDLIFHFSMAQIRENRALDPGSVDAVLTADILGGDAAEADLLGSDTVHMVPPKSKRT